MEVNPRMDALKLPKPVPGEHRKKRRMRSDARMKVFSKEVKRLDLMEGYMICCNPDCRCKTERLPYRPANRSRSEATHLLGRGRSPATKYDTRYGMTLCWWSHDLTEKNDKETIKILLWHKENNRPHFEKRGWALPLAALENSVALKKVGT